MLQVTEIKQDISSKPGSIDGNSYCNYNSLNGCHIENYLFLYLTIRHGVVPDVAVLLA